MQLADRFKEQQRKSVRCSAFVSLDVLGFPVAVAYLSAVILAELVAELGAAFMCAEFGFDNDEKQKDEAAYLAHWVRFLEDHDHAIVSAASMASKAVEFLRGKVAEEPLAEAA